MATFDSTVRLRQLNKPELSGYIIEVIGEIPNTGELVNSFYPLNSNPNSYITTGQTGNFITQEELDSNYYSTLIYVGNNYYPLSNPYNYISSNAALVYSTGNQNVSGTKNFYTRPTVNGTGVLLSGEAAGGNTNLQNVVYITGDQSISGGKIFLGNFEVGDGFDPVNFIVHSSLLSFSENINLYGLSFGENQFYLQHRSGIIDLYDGTINNFDSIYAQKIYQSGVKVATVEDLNSAIGFDLQNVVYKTGDQTIDGIKNFLKRPTFNGTGVLLSGEAGNITITGIGSGYQIYSGYANGNYNFRSISGGAGINISVSNDQKVLNLNTTGLVFKYETGNFLTSSSNVVYTTGDQEINGIKTFINGISIGYFPDDYLSFQANGSYFRFLNENGKGLLFSQNYFIITEDNGFIDFHNGNITGFKNISGTNIYQNGLRVATTGDLNYQIGLVNSDINSIEIWTGSTVNLYYPKKSNPSGYLTSAITVLTVKDYNLTGNVTLSGAGGVSISTGNPYTIIISGGTGGFNGIINNGFNLPGGSGIFSSVNGDKLEFKSLKPGSGIRIIGDSNTLTFEVTGIVGGNGGSPILENVVYTTGDQTIEGNKTFSNKLIVDFINNSASNDAYTNCIGLGAGTEGNGTSSNFYTNFIGFNAGNNNYGYNINSNLIGYWAGADSESFNHSNFIGVFAGRATNSCYNSNFIGNEAGYNSYQCYNSNFIGVEAGQSSTDSIYCNFIGEQAGYFAQNCTYSNFIGNQAGNSAYTCGLSIFIGNQAGFAANYSDDSIMIGSSAGKSSQNVKNSIFIGKQAGYANVIPSTSETEFFSILIGNYTSTNTFFNTIAIGQGAANNTERQLNIGNILYGVNINTGITPSSTPISSGKIGILIENPEYTLDVSGDCRITGQTVFGVRPTVNGSGVLLIGEASQGNTSNENLITEKNGYGAGIYTFSNTFNNGASGNIFGIFDSKSGCQIFDVMINAEYPVAKKYSVVHQRGQNPISYLNVNSGPSGSNDFDVLFFASGLSGVAMNVKNNGVNSEFLTTLFLGASVNNVTVTGYL